MHVVNIPTLKSFVRHIAVRLRESVMIWGPPGIGKSEAIRQLCAELGARLVDIRVSQYDSVDLRGFPGVDAETGTTVWHMPSTLPFKGNPNFSEEGLIFLFLDEITSGTPNVLAACYQLINDGGIGEHELMDNVVVVAAGNRDGDRGVTTKMPMPLANRFTHIEAGVDHEATMAYFSELGLSPVAIAYYHFKGDRLMTFSPDNPNKSFSTPRTVEKAVRYFMDPELPDEVKRAAMAGAMGHGEAADFWGFVDTYQQVTPIKDIIANPEGVPIPDANQPGLRWAMAIHVSGHMTPDDPVSGKKGNVGPLHRYLKRLPGDMAVVAWQLAVQRNDQLFTTPEYLDFAKVYRAVFR